MNGALGVVRDFLWPSGGVPNSPDSRKRGPLCVVVEFDDVDMGVDPVTGQRRSFFPDDEEKRWWVPIYRHQIYSNSKEGASRELFPLKLAWALTPWQVQGKTLSRVRISLGKQSAAVPGIVYTAVTCVRHPADLVFEEDLPEYEHFMKARKTPTFRERRRFELRQQARASWTLRRYGFCEADVWSPEEREAAKNLLGGLKTQASAQRERLRNQGRPLDANAWLWPGGEPNYGDALAEEVVRLAGEDAGQREMLAGVAEHQITDATKNDHRRQRC